jgi:hypothetical protein
LLIVLAPLTEGGAFLFWPRGNRIPASLLHLNSRVSRFDLLALADIKRFVNAASLPADDALTAEADAFAEAVARPTAGCSGIGGPAAFRLRS